MVSRDTGSFEIEFSAIKLWQQQNEEQRNLRGWMQRHDRSELNMNAMIAFDSAFQLLPDSGEGSLKMLQQGNKGIVIYVRK